MNKYKIILVLGIVLTLIIGTFTLTGCKNKNKGNGEIMEFKENPVVCITLKDESEIKLELYPDIAPITVSNFIKLVEKKFYDGVCFHRVIDKFMIQAGGYYIEDNYIKDKEKVDPIKGEFSGNGVQNDLKHELGVISMARTSDKNSASSQFFICSATSPHLDGQYAAFGKAIDAESIQVILAVSRSETINIGGGMTDFPNPPVEIKTIRRIK